MDHPEEDMRFNDPGEPRTPDPTTLAPRGGNSEPQETPVPSYETIGKQVDSVVVHGSDSTRPIQGQAPPPQRGEPLSGDVPAELIDHPRYELLRRLGQGGMGAVYLARHKMMDRQVALKITNRSLLADPSVVERFHREVRAAARLSHPNIVTAYDAEQAGAVHFLCMEFVEGTDLAQLIRAHGPLPVETACAFIQQAALGLQHAHERGMIHRDIKPHNLMLTAGNQVKILDFGLARIASASRGETEGSGETLTAQGMYLGTPDYMAPEQASDSRSADIRSDIYSLGCTFFCLLAGKPPFAGGSSMEKLVRHCSHEPPPVTEVRQDVPARVQAILDRMLAKDPAARYQIPGDVAAELQNLLCVPSEVQAPHSSENATLITEATDLVKPDTSPTGAPKPVQALPPSAPPQASDPAKSNSERQSIPHKIGLLLGLTTVGFMALAFFGPGNHQEESAPPVAKTTPPGAKTIPSAVKPVIPIPLSREPTVAPVSSPTTGTSLQPAAPSLSSKPFESSATPTLKPTFADALAALRRTKPIFQTSFAGPDTHFSEGALAKKIDKGSKKFKNGKYVISWKRVGNAGTGIGPFKDGVVAVRCSSHGPEGHLWGVILNGTDQNGKPSLLLTSVDPVGYSISLDPPARLEAENAAPTIEAIPSMAIRGRGQSNELVLVVKERQLVLIVNGKVLTEPIKLIRVLSGFSVRLWVHGSVPAEAEFEALTVWPASTLEIPASGLGKRRAQP